MRQKRLTPNPIPNLRRVTQPEAYEEAPDWLVDKRYGFIRDYNERFGDQVEARAREQPPVNLVRDLAAHEQGGKLLHEDTFTDKVRRAIGHVQQKVSPDEQNYWGFDAGKFTQAQESAYEFIKTADLSKVATGNTPVEKALHYMLSASMSQNGDNQPGTGGEDAIPQQIARSPEAAQEMAEKLNDAWEKVSGMSTQEKQELLAGEDEVDKKHRRRELGEPPKDEDEDEGEEDDEGQADYGDGHTYDPHDDRPMPNDAYLVSIQAKNNIIDIIDQLGRHLDVRIETTVAPSVEFQDDPDGKEIYARQIEGPNEIPFLSPFDKFQLMHNPTFAGYRIATGEAIVLPRATKQTRKQLVVITLDRSGSMFSRRTNSSRHGSWNYRVGMGILMNRIKYANKGHAEVHWNLFADNAGRFMKVDENNPMDYGDACKKMMEANVGGGTYLLGAIESAVRYIRENWDEDEHTSTPDIIVITDGNDSSHEMMIREKTYKVTKRDGTTETVRLNVFVIGPKVSFRIDPETMETEAREYWEGKRDASLIEGGATHALSIAAKMTGGSVWYLDPDTGEELDPTKIFTSVSPSITHNPYKHMGWTI